MSEKPAPSEGQNSEPTEDVVGVASATTCWGLAVNMEKSEHLGFTTQVTKRLMVGYMFAETEDEAVGTFMRRCYKDCPGFKADSPVTIRIPNARSDAPGAFE